MRRLIVQCHPVEDSYNGALLAALVQDSPTELAVIRVGQGDRLTAQDLASADRVTFVYPTWWGSPPAALLDQVVDLIRPWVDGPVPADPSPMRNVTHLDIVTTHGSRRWTNRLQGEPGLALWKRTVLPLCAPGARFDWCALYGMDFIGDSERRRFLASIS